MPNKPTFSRATKQQAKLRLALAGPAGSGKTYTALQLAVLLAGEAIPAVIDTERGSADKYADLFTFDALQLDSFHPDRYIEAIGAAESAGYPVLVIDSLSHAWIGKDGALELVDRTTKRSQSGNSFGAWREVTPLQNALVDAILRSSAHVIVTLRSKQEYVQEKDRNNKTIVRKVGLAPVQRDGLEYEFDVYGDMTVDNDLVIGKTRCPALSGAVLSKPGAELAETLMAWLAMGEPVAAPDPLELERKLRERYLDGYATLWNKAKGLGIKVVELKVDELTNEQLKAAGTELKELVEAEITRREAAQGGSR